MNGTMQGNMIAVLYFLLFQVCGLLLGQAILKTERRDAKILGGSVLGSVLLQWIPVLFAFALGFTITAHLLALAVTAVVSGVVFWKFGRTKMETATEQKLQVRFGILPLLVYGLFVWLVFSGFEVRNGTVYSSQATYGDMSMHLGFITSIAQQQTFPPDYSILPGTKLSYPFLSDSISSSLYLFGASLRLSYCFPMLFAGAQVMYGAWLFLRTWLGTKGKTLFAWMLYFLNGGLGFIYLFSGEGGLLQGLKQNFTAFYETPTNFVEHNVRWVNMIVDMLLPQRATLFGYAVLFFSLYLLYRAVWQNERRLFAVVGLFAGALPMIHTHSFLALALVSGCWLMMYLIRECKVHGVNRILVELLFSLILFMQILQWIILGFNLRDSSMLLVVLAIFAAVFIYGLVCLLSLYVKKYSWNALMHTWGMYFIIAACLALPQLVLWTFGQATGDGFFRGYFNWANIDNNYLWFYLKNIGVAFVLFLLGYAVSGKKFTYVAFPVMIIWLIAELAVFQPNVYDNNKLLYVAYLLMCGVAAEFAVNVYHKIRNKGLANAIGAVVVVLCAVSALLTMGREVVAEYELFGKKQCELAEFVMKNTDPDATILTNTRHNNAIAALSGRNILCGSSSYLYYHGLDYADQHAATRVMYEEPDSYPEIFQQYGIDYILVSAYERSTYEVNEEAIAERFDCIYQNGDINLYRVN